MSNWVKEWERNRVTERVRLREIKKNSKTEGEPVGERVIGKDRERERNIEIAG